MRDGAGRRREPAAQSRDGGGRLRRAHAVGARALQYLRRRGRRLRARRGLRPGAAQDPVARACRRRHRAGRDPRLGGEPGRPQPRPERPERTGPGAGDARCAGPRAARSGRGRLPGDARYRHAARRSGRGAGDRHRLWPRRGAPRAARAGRREGQHGPWRIGRRHRRADQAGATAASRQPAAGRASRYAEPAFRGPRRTPAVPEGRGHRVAARASVGGRAEFVRLHRHQCAPAALPRRRARRRWRGDPSRASLRASPLLAARLHDGARGGAAGAVRAGAPPVLRDQHERARRRLPAGWRIVAGAPALPARPRGGRRGGAAGKLLRRHGGACLRGRARPRRAHRADEPAAALRARRHAAGPLLPRRRARGRHAVGRHPDAPRRPRGLAAPCARQRARGAGRGHGG